jgi:hypothetical protein
MRLNTYDYLYKPLTLYELFISSQYGTEVLQTNSETEPTYQCTEEDYDNGVGNHCSIDWIRSNTRIRELQKPREK